MKETTTILSENDRKNLQTFLVDHYKERFETEDPWLEGRDVTPSDPMGNYNDPNFDSGEAKYVMGDEDMVNFF